MNHVKMIKNIFKLPKKELNDLPNIIYGSLLFVFRE